MVEQQSPLKNLKANILKLEINKGEDAIILIEKLMDLGEVQLAIEVSKNLENAILDGELEFNSKGNLSDYECYESNKTIISLLDDENLIYKCVDNYKIINKRDPDKSYDGIDTWFKYEDTLNSITICGRTTIMCNMFHLVAMFKEIDLLQESVGQFEFLRVIKELSFSKWIAHCGIKMPMTFSNRDMVLIGIALFDRVEKLFIISFKSTKKEFYDFIPDCDNKHERIDMNFGFYIAKYIDDKTCELFTCFNVDPKVSVPWFILNSITKDVGYYMMSDLRKICQGKDFAKKYQERIDKNPEAYNKIKSAIM